MPIRFRCEDCQARIKVPDGTQGRKVKCPRCGKTQRVPESAAAGDSTAAAPSEPTPTLDAAPVNNPTNALAAPAAASRGETLPQEELPGDEPTDAGGFRLNKETSASSKASEVPESPEASDDPKQEEQEEQEQERPQAQENPAKPPPPHEPPASADAVAAPDASGADDGRLSDEPGDEDARAAPAAVATASAASPLALAPSPPSSSPLVSASESPPSAVVPPVTPRPTPAPTPPAAVPLARMRRPRPIPQPRPMSASDAQVGSGGIASSPSAISSRPSTPTAAPLHEPVAEPPPMARILRRGGEPMPEPDEGTASEDANGSWRLLEVWAWLLRALAIVLGAGSAKILLNSMDKGERWSQVLIEVAYYLTLAAVAWAVGEIALGLRHLLRRTR